ncbi:MAG: hypothetical protein CMP22_01025 [Rickettsiales bacterium]|nr:hypothetical protein [Rickettsiales bacterium]
MLNIIKRFTFLFAIMALTLSSVAVAQEWNPNLVEEKLADNPFFKKLIDKGVKLVPLGSEYGFDAWLMQYNDQIQIFYTVEGTNSAVSGFLIGENGENLTALQIAKYQALSGNDLSDILNKSSKTMFSPDLMAMTPSERFYKDASEAKWLSFGSNTPYDDENTFYIFMDPTQPQSIDYFEHLMKRQKEGLGNPFTAKIIPIARTPESLDYLEKIYKHPKSAEMFYRTLVEDFPLEGNFVTSADLSLSVKAVLAQNYDVLKKRNLEKLPLTLFKDKDGQIKLVSGMPKDLNELYGQAPSLPEIKADDANKAE